MKPLKNFMPEYGELAEQFFLRYRNSFESDKNHTPFIDKKLVKRLSKELATKKKPNWERASAALFNAKDWSFPIEFPTRFATWKDIEAFLAQDEILDVLPEITREPDEEVDDYLDDYPL